MPKKHPRMKHPSARQLAPVIDALAKKANFEWMPTNVFLLQSAVYGLIKRIEDGNFKSAKDAFDLKQLLQIAKSFETENPDIQEITEMGATLMDWLRYTPQSRSPHDTIALHLQWRDLKEYFARCGYEAISSRPQEYLRESLSNGRPQ